MMKRLTELSPAILSVVTDQADALHGIGHCKWIPVSLLKNKQKNTASVLADLRLVVFGYKAKLNSQGLS